MYIFQNCKKQAKSSVKKWSFQNKCICSLRGKPEVAARRAALVGAQLFSFMFGEKNHHYFFKGIVFFIFYITTNSVILIKLYLFRKVIVSEWSSKSLELYLKYLYRAELKCWHSVQLWKWQTSMTDLNFFNTYEDFLKKWHFCGE